MKNELYSQIYEFNNLFLAYKKARKHKNKKDYVIEFEKDLRRNLLQIQKELREQTYFPKPLKTFIISDPKSRVISKSAFRDRIVHHAIILIIEELFEKSFIYDSCANRIGKGTLFAINRLGYFKRKVTKNFLRNAFCLKADIKHYFDEVNHEILIDRLKNKIYDENILELVKIIIKNFRGKSAGTGMPLGNLTSQFFANVYLDKLDKFVKHILKAGYYIRYVDDFIILHESKKQLEIWKKQIVEFLKEKLKLELHPQKSRIIPLKRGIDFVGFRHFYYFKLLRKRNIRNMKRKIEMFKQGLISKDKLLESFQGWNAYARWADSFKLRIAFAGEIMLNAGIKILPETEEFKKLGIRPRERTDEVLVYVSEGESKIY